MKAVLDLKDNYFLTLYRFTHIARAKFGKRIKNSAKVLVWAINKKKEALEYAKKCVEGIVSDNPDILKI